MELAHNHSAGLLFSIYPSFLPCSSRPRRFSLKSLFGKERSFKKRIGNLAGRWSFHVREMLKAGDLSRGALIHVVKEGESLSSISRKYGVPINTITALNRDIVDVDLVYEGQHLRIPALCGCTQWTETSSLFNFNLNQRQIQRRALNVVNQLSSQHKNFTMLILQRLPPAKAAGYFLVLVPFIAFCIRCMIGVFCTKIIGPPLRNHQEHEPKRHHHGSSRGTRWKSALLEPKEADAVDTESAIDVNSSAEDGPVDVTLEDVSGNYRKLEMDYQKFLSECGITDSGCNLEIGSLYASFRVPTLKSTMWGHRLIEGS